jgi:hypothetical protein
MQDVSLALGETDCEAEHKGGEMLFKQRVDEDGNTLGYYIDHPGFYCDLEEEGGVWSVYFRDKKTDQEVFEEQSNKPARSEILSWIEDRSSWGSDDYLGRVALIVEEALAHWSPKTRREGRFPGLPSLVKHAIVKG